MDENEFKILVLPHRAVADDYFSDLSEMVSAKKSDGLGSVFHGKDNGDDIEIRRPKIKNY